jgi:hypothetical protein
MPSLAELRDQIRLARIEKEQLAEKIAHTSTGAQKRHAVRQYNITIGNLKGMASNLESAIDARKRAMAERRLS